MSSAFSFLELPHGFWLRRQTSQSGPLGAGEIVTLGLSEAAQADLGELTFAELPTPPQVVRQGQSLGIVESVKSVQELLCPVSGTVVEINEAVLETPELVNESPLERGWLLKIELAAPLDVAPLAV